MTFIFNSYFVVSWHCLSFSVFTLLVDSLRYSMIVYARECMLENACWSVYAGVCMLECVCWGGIRRVWLNQLIVMQREV